MYLNTVFKYNVFKYCPALGIDYQFVTRDSQNHNNLISLHSKWIASEDVSHSYSLRYI